ncbi:DUF805 domain-containing protein [Kitasatospora sp. GAS204B]|uniref:DUF805 domain-containing protein n=1 Tax=unclassified Kitasatospora TaxID=2633591 RepID=UPI00247389DB|nr:DUF805 domain-containing protein [Kitasatospora sp. GAS204B]MDH6118418.1 uncharacterized membrane protein YhaH (DUF805 family) [Kitasatospora sp. GAS204B]
MNWYLAVLKNYVGFSGRARRQEYWMFVLINVVISIILEIVDAAAGTNGVISGLYTLAVLLPTLAVLFRRLHDTGRAGWWVLIGVIPLIGAIVLIVFTAGAGQPEANQYGPNPKLTAATV